MIIRLCLEVGSAYASNRNKLNSKFKLNSKLKLKLNSKLKLNINSILVRGCVSHSLFFIILLYCASLNYRSNKYINLITFV